MPDRAETAMRTCLPFGLVVVLLGVASCRNPVSDTEPEPVLTGVTWELVSFQQTSGIRTDIGPHGMTLRFLDTGVIEGHLYAIEQPNDGSSADYGATYRTEPNGVLAITPINWVGRPPIMFPFGSRWYEYWSAMHDASGYRLRGDDLDILYDSTKALNFRVNPNPVE